MRANKTSTPASLRPQKALQKSRERFCGIGECALAYFESEVVEGWRRADIISWRSTEEALWAVGLWLSHAFDKPELPAALVY